MISAVMEKKWIIFYPQHRQDTRSKNKNAKSQWNKIEHFFF